MLNEIFGFDFCINLLNNAIDSAYGKYIVFATRTHKDMAPTYIVEKEELKTFLKRRLEHRTIWRLDSYKSQGSPLTVIECQDSNRLYRYTLKPATDEELEFCVQTTGKDLEEIA